MVGHVLSIGREMGGWSVIVDCGSLKMKGIRWKGAILMEEDGGSWKRNCEWL